MKRCIKWLINWFEQWWSKMSWQEKLGFAMGALLGIVLSIIVFISLDTVPATPDDYKLLENQVISINQNPGLLLKNDCDINVNNEVITVKFENDECKITAKYDQNFEILSVLKEDNAISALPALASVLVTGFFSYAFGAIIFTIVICLIDILWKLICKAFKSSETKFQKQ